MAKSEKFVFQKHDTIGAADAEGDNFLNNCFVDIGDLKVLVDCGESRSIVVGRTGTGKTALLQQVLKAENKRCIEIHPENLSLTYISNSTIISYLSKLGVNLEVFYKLLWRHVFVIEIIKHYFSIKTEEDLSSFKHKCIRIFRDQKQKNALDYLEKWGSTFWQESEYRIKEITNELESKVKASLGPKFTKMCSLEWLTNGNQAEKIEVLHKAQTVVDSVQVRQLSDIISLIDDLLVDPQKQYIIVIDNLDNNWTDDKLRYKLIYALIESVRDFRKVANAKIVVAIRLDLLERVFRLASSSGHQEEKYRALYLKVGWDKKRLINILDSRINYLVNQRCGKGNYTHQRLLPDSIKGKSAADFFVDRTLMQPRDIIHFFNQCIQKAQGCSSINCQTVLDAEGEYSRLRLNYLSDEWAVDYPFLKKFSDILRKKKASFIIEDVEDAECEDFCLTHVTEYPDAKDSLSMLAKHVVEVLMTSEEFLKKVFLIFHRVGLLGLKVETYEKFIWATDSDRTISAAEITSKTHVRVHPAFHRRLGINDKSA